MVRGLVIDKKRGNVLKMDRHNYVKVVVHGFKAVSTEERLMTYCDSSKVGTSFTGTSIKRWIRCSRWRSVFVLPTGGNERFSYDRREKEEK